MVSFRTEKMVYLYIFLMENAVLRTLSLYDNVLFSTSQIFLAYRQWNIWILTEPLKPKEQPGKHGGVCDQTHTVVNGLGTRLIRKFLFCLPCLLIEYIRVSDIILLRRQTRRKITSKSGCFAANLFPRFENH